MLILTQFCIMLALAFATVAIFGSMAKAARLVGQVQAHDRHVKLSGHKAPIMATRERKTVSASSRHNGRNHFMTATKMRAKIQLAA